MWFLGMIQFFCKEKIVLHSQIFHPVDQMGLVKCCLHRVKGKIVARIINR